MRIRTFDARSASDELVTSILDADDRFAWPDPSAARDWFRRKFSRSPAGPSLIALGEEDDRIAGVVAFGRMRLLLDGESVPCALSYETFVNSDFRRRGLFLELLDHATSTARDAGIRLLFNFPNAASLPGFLKRGWMQRRGFQNWLLPLRPIGLLSAIAPRRAEGEFRPAVPAEPPIGSRDLTPFLSSNRDPARAASAIEPDYDEDFLLWRYSPEWQIDYHTVGESGLPMVVRTGERWGLREVQVMEIARDRVPSYSRIARTLGEIRERWSPAVVSASLSLASSHPPASAAWVPSGTDPLQLLLPAARR